MMTNWVAGITQQTNKKTQKKRAQTGYEIETIIQVLLHARYLFSHSNNGRKRPLGVVGISRPAGEYFGCARAGLINKFPT